MLSRVIDSVGKNPEYLRATIYELARHKLKEEFKSESFADVRKLSKSLEIAIQGVEAFNKKRKRQKRSCQDRMLLRRSRSYGHMLHAKMSRQVSNRLTR